MCTPRHTPMFSRRSIHPPSQGSATSSDSLSLFHTTAPLTVEAAGDSNSMFHPHLAFAGAINPHGPSPTAVTTGPG